MNFLQQMGFGGIGGLGGFSPMGWPGMGMQTLMGSPMGSGFSPFMGGMPMGDPFTMFQMMQNMFAQQAQQGQQAQQNQGAGPTWQAQSAPTFAPDERQSPHQQMQALRTFANRNGSRDGTPIADWTSPNQDASAGDYLTGLMDKQSERVAADIRSAPPHERALLQAEERKLMDQEARRQADRRPMTGSERLQAQIDYTERLAREGRINPRLAQSNRQLNEIKQYGDQTFANMFLKQGLPVPKDMPADAIARSPYNRQAR